MKNKNKIKNILLKILSFSFSFTLKEKIQQIEQKMNRKKCRYILMLYVIIPLACYSTAHCVYNLHSVYNRFKKCHYHHRCFTYSILVCCLFFLDVQTDQQLKICFWQLTDLRNIVRPRKLCIEGTVKEKWKGVQAES